uniref:NADH:ubiquinone oxidoreductase intermediate-associated protein 30 domain-containing protein n=1 Tax=Haptolina ericina TaxID=156174 RepID=A0A7S3AS24_9EUKA
MEFKTRAKSDTLQAPSSFLRLPHVRVRPLQLFRINDGVMGGRSTSTVAANRDGSVEFEGTINTNGGGFASFRTLGDEAPLGFSRNSVALVVDASGDGQSYKASLHTADSWSMSVPSWGHDFQAGARRKHRLPLKGFLPSRQGRLIATPPLDPAEVTGVGFALSLYTADGKPNPKFGDGPFRLTIHSIEVEETA